LPETFVDDSLRTTQRFGEDLENSASTIYLIMKTGGGAKREGLGRGIHWHIVNEVYYYAQDPEKQEIPYVRVMNDDGTISEYVDVESDFDPANVNEDQLHIVECTTCHNRVSHEFKPPEVSVDEAMSRGLISADIPGIRLRSVEVLSTIYESREAAVGAIDDLEEYYKSTDYYPGHGDQISQAVQTLKDIYDRTVFLDQKVDWKTHPDNIGHVYSAGCFRCHDGKHLDEDDHAIRLECNVCHSIPVVANEQDFIVDIEISRGPEPESHLNPNWITLHRDVFDPSCEGCHTTEDPGGVSNTSFCSNSACHGSVYTYAGFDAPALREILEKQLPPAAPTVEAPDSEEELTFDSYISALFATKCGACHGSALQQKDLDLSTYASTLQGGEGGPAILPGDSAGSLLVQVQNEQHFTTFSGDELEVIVNWIDAGAPEN
jgi:hypothetical protein